MTIYVPADLAEEVRNAAGFNASQVAQEAFREALRKRGSTDTAARLRGTLDADAARWRQWGDEWARGWATVGELEGLVGMMKRKPEYFQPVSHHTIRAYLAETGRIPGLREGWKRMEMDPLFESFVAGALEVWESVREDVYAGTDDDA